MMLSSSENGWTRVSLSATVKNWFDEKQMPLENVVSCATDWEICHYM